MTMKGLLLLNIALLLSISCAFCQNSDFYYTKTSRESNFIEDRLGNIDNYLIANDVPIDSAFATRSGIFDIVFFERYVYGESVLGDYTFSHEAIISKVYKGIIIESYFVSYDWKELPMSTPIQVSRKKLPIESVMNVNDFEFKLLNELGSNLIEDNCKIIIPDNVNLLHDSQKAD